MFEDSGFEVYETSARLKIQRKKNGGVGSTYVADARDSRCCQKKIVKWSSTRLIGQSKKEIHKYNDD